MTTRRKKTKLPLNGEAHAVAKTKAPHEIEIPRYGTCEWCRGTGRWDEEFEVCFMCDGEDNG